MEGKGHLKAKGQVAVWLREVGWYVIEEWPPGMQHTSMGEKDWTFDLIAFKTDAAGNIVDAFAVEIDGQETGQNHSSHRNAVRDAGRDWYWNETLGMATVRLPTPWVLDGTVDKETLVQEVSYRRRLANPINVFKVREVLAPLRRYAK